MSARAISLRELVIEDVARTSERTGRHALPRLLRRVDVSVEDLTAAALDLPARSAAAAALAMLGTETFGADLRAAEILADECGLSVEEWTVETCCEQGVEVSP